MRHAIAYSLLRSIFGAMAAKPRGIDRIDFGVMSYLFQRWPGDCFGVLPTPFGVRYYPRDRILRGCKLLASMWGEEGGGADSDPAAERLRDALAGRRSSDIAAALRNVRPARPRYGRALRLLLNEGFDLGRPVSSLPPGCLYLDMGHYSLATPMFNRWLDRRPDVAPVFMIHDVIPLQFKHLVAPDTERMHRRVMASAARWARSIIVPTPSAGVTIAEEMARLGRSDVPIHPLPHPIDETFLCCAERFPEAATVPYFVICGAVEPRKNHAILFKVWKHLLDKAVDPMPKLVVAGPFGYTSASILAELATDPRLENVILVATNLTTPSLARLISGARALLMPSYAEGFGLPPVEAMSLGTPAVLSDIPAHRDAAGESGLYVPPDDVAGWLRAVEMLLSDTPERQAIVRRVASFSPMTWPAYVRRLEAVFDQSTARDTAPRSGVTPDTVSG